MKTSTTSPARTTASRRSAKKNGSMQVRIPAEMHRKLKMMAARQRTTITGLLQHFIDLNT